MTTPLPPFSALYDYSLATASNTNGAPPRPLHSLRAEPITHFSNVPNDGIGNDKIKLTRPDLADGVPTAGRLLAVNANYIAYAVKKGLVRVMHRATGAKALLRGHDEKTTVIDAAFWGDDSNLVGVGSNWKALAVLQRIKKHSPGKTSRPLSPSPPQKPMASNLLATVGGMGKNSGGVIIWALQLGLDGVLQYQNVQSLGVAFATRVVWNPICPEFVLLHRNASKSVDESSVGTKERDVPIGVLVNKSYFDQAALAAAAMGTSKAPEFMHNMAVKSVSDGSGGGGGGGSGGGSFYVANDIAWSGMGWNLILTGHNDGIRLWDKRSSQDHDQSSTSHHQRGSRQVLVETKAKMNTIHPIFKLNVTSPSSPQREDAEDENGSSSGAVTRVIFLNSYEDSMTTFISGDALPDTQPITPPFITGIDMNHTVTLWSSFTYDSKNPSNIDCPTKLRVFGLRNHVNDNIFPLSDMISLELCPAPYRPPLSLRDSSLHDIEEDATVPSSFLLMAERNSGLLHALHLETKWKASLDGRDAAASVAVKGFDYVTTLNVVHPIYSFCVAPVKPAGSDSNGTEVKKNALKEDCDVDLCCIQSKAVQTLTLAAEMCAPPEGNNGAAKDLAPGVTLLNLDDNVEDDVVVDDVVDDEEEVFEEGDFEEEYEMDDDDLANAEFSTNHSDDEDDVEGAVPTEEVSDAAASNWLGAIVNPRPATTPARASSAPPGLALPPGLSLPPAPSPMSFLSPMQILSESSSELEVSNQEMLVKLPPSAVTAVAAALGSPPSNKPVTKVKKQKGQDGKKKVETKQTVTPMKILQRDEPKDEFVVESIQPVSVAAVPSADLPVVSVSKIDLGDIESIVQRSIAAQLKTHETELISSLKKIIAAEVKSVITSSFKDVEKATEQAVQRGIASGLSTGLKKGLDGELGKRLDKHAKDSVASATKEALDSMQPLIMNALHQTMRDAMIPAYEAATRQMFEQTSIALERGFKELAVNQANTLAPTMQAVSTEMKNINAVVAMLAAEVAKLRTEVTTVSSTKQADEIPQQIEVPQKRPLDIREEIKALSQANRYEEAFTKAVSASDGEIVLFACKITDSAAVFNGEVAISQPILICLLQQLGAVLVAATETDDLKTILNWLQEIAVTIDPTNVNIQRHVKSVVEQLLANINSKMSNCNPAFRRPLQTLMQVIRGLL